MLFASCQHRYGIATERQFKVELRTLQHGWQKCNKALLLIVFTGKNIQKKVNNGNLRSQALSPGLDLFPPPSRVVWVAVHGFSYTTSFLLWKILYFTTSVYIFIQLVSSKQLAISIPRLTAIIILFICLSPLLAKP